MCPLSSACPCRFDACSDATISRPGTFTLVLRKWCNLHPSMLFRCFVRERRLVGELCFRCFLCWSSLVWSDIRKGQTPPPFPPSPPLFVLCCGCGQVGFAASFRSVRLNYHTFGSACCFLCVAVGQEAGGGACMLRSAFFSDDVPDAWRVNPRPARLFCSRPPSLCLCI